MEEGLIRTVSYSRKNLYYTEDIGASSSLKLTKNSFRLFLGQGDMAVSNTLGSNVFDVLIGLALPWFIKTTMVSPGTTVSMIRYCIFLQE